MFLLVFFLKVRTTQYTLWKFQDLSITQILREINFEESRSSKIDLFAILGALKILLIWCLQKVQKLIK